MRTAIALPFAIFAAPFAIGCGPTCQATCDKLYGTTGDACHIERAGTTETDLKNTCMDHCEAALEIPGALGNYNPDERQGSSAAIDIETDKQAAVWMDCIAETACEDLTRGYCAPVW
ncbi:MAG: hypothetical protein ABIO70_14405 [Pseudomonadota bacterium]